MKMTNGFMLPLGSVTGGGSGTSASSFSDGFTGFIPAMVEAGYRFNPNLMVGAFFQFALGIAKDCGAGLSCSGNDLTVGLEAHYHFAPQEKADPWAGVGVGYEWLPISISQGGSSLGAPSICSARDRPGWPARSGRSTGPRVTCGPSWPAR